MSQEAEEMEETRCYTEEEEYGMDWRAIANSDRVEWVSLFNPNGPTITPPCDHSPEECPAKNKNIQNKN